MLLRLCSDWQTWATQQPQAHQLIVLEQHYQRQCVLSCSAWLVSWLVHHSLLPGCGDVYLLLLNRCLGGMMVVRGFACMRGNRGHVVSLFVWVGSLCSSLWAVVLGMCFCACVHSAASLCVIFFPLQVLCTLSVAGSLLTRACIHNSVVVRL